MDTENTQVSKEKKFQKPQGEKRPNSAPGNRDKPRPEFKKPNFKKEQKETENNVTEKAVEQEGAPANEAGEDSNALPGKPTDNKPESREKKGRIFLSNLVYDTNEKMLRKLCAEFGPIKEVAIPMDASTNKPKGFAFLEFENKNSALKAVTKLNNSKWKGRNIGVSLAVDKRKYLETADEGKRAASAGKTDGQKGPGAQGSAGETPASGIVDGIEIVKSKTKGPRAGGENAPAENGAEDEKKMNRKERRAITNAIQGKGKVGEGDEAEEEAGAKQQAKKGKGKQDNEKGKKMTKEEEDEMDELDRIVMANIQELGGNFDLDEEDDEEEEEAPKKGAKDATKTKKSKIANEIEDEPMDEEDLGESKVGIREIDVKAEAKKLASAGQQKSDYKDLLEEKEKELKKKEVKKNEEEDMSHTCFIRGVSFDVNEKELYKFIKENIGDIVYLKMVKFKANETKHNGNGFIKFKDQNVMQRVIEMTEQFNNGNYVPKPKDPKVELNGIRIQFFQALRKQDAKDIKIQREKELAKKDEPEKKERHKKFKSMEELIAGDKTGKRRLAYTKLGFFDAIDEEKLNDFDKQQRQSHRQEKLVKMGNPNYFVSEKRVLLKNIDKLLTDLQVKKLISEVLSNRLSQTDLKKQKIFSDVKIITSKTEESTGKSSVS
jgi:nucleolar protein 4